MHISKQRIIAPNNKKKSMQFFAKNKFFAITIWSMLLLSLLAKSCKGFCPSRTSFPISLIPNNNLARSTPRIIGRYQQPERIQQFHRNNYHFQSLSMSQNNNSNLITSPKSQTVKKIQALLSKRKQRLKHGQTIVEGPRMVFDLLDNPNTAHLVRQILVSAHDYELREDYRSRLFGSGGEDTGRPRNNVLVQLVLPEIFSDCTATITPQGIVAIVDIPEKSLMSNDNKDIEDDDDQRYPLSDASPVTARMYLILDGVSDPGNLGTLLRSSLAVGVAGVVLLPDCCDVWNPKAVRSAMGASFQVPILECKSWEEALQMLQSTQGVERVYAATMIENEDGDDTAPSASVPYFDIDWTLPSALVIGSEGNGLSPVIRQDLVARKNRKNSSDNVVVRATHIPMGTGIESLNAAVCGSVILFEYARQCQRPP